MNGRRMVYSISRRLYFQLFFLAIKHPRPILLFASRASPVDSYGGGSAPQRRLLICRQTSAVYLYSPRLRRRFRRSILTAGVPPPNDGCLFVDKPPPSISTLRDFVAAFAGLFLRRLCDPPFFTLDSIITRDYSSSLREITLQCYERLQFNVTRD